MKRPMTKSDWICLMIVGVCIAAVIECTRQYILLPEPSTDKCLYMVKYLHVSGKEIDKKVYGDCEGFYHGFVSDKYKFEMGVVFHSGYTVKIHGATDILSVAKIEDL